jgi:transketolase
VSLDQHLNHDLYKPSVPQEAIRSGFGRGLVAAAHIDKNIVAISADLTASTKMDEFAKSYPERFVQVGIAEQNLAAVGSGMAAAGKIPFISSYAAFSPGRNWEQIKTTIALNDVNVKIVGSHAGLMTGADGATHQMLEDIVLMRVMPNMIVVVPCDAIEAEKATLAIAKHVGPCYIRMARDKSAVITTRDSPFSLAKAQILREGSDITIVACGTMVHPALLAAEKLAEAGIHAEVINAAVIKPLDTVTINVSASKTGAVITIEEGQINGGLGGAIAETLGDNNPVPMIRMGVHDRFGESGTAQELFEYFGLTPKHIVARAKELLKRKGTK